MHIFFLQLKRGKSLAFLSLLLVAVTMAMSIMGLHAHFP